MFDFNEFVDKYLRREFKAKQIGRELTGTPKYRLFLDKNLPRGSIQFKLFKTINESKYQNNPQVGLKIH